eukprot:CAMPEP_0173130932 /NCGR_PEP_ID=MMETSP1102-20130122/60335_1 /TAXON_ID=49646 /ORGANISM="Geminigera sp., Strain Caron Lab Isolate" /LENGTH=187 /DNA_ID=CAMNT_0014042143 /DNA_START=439 /DNA_END=1002 /DNA_ORIENTATION=+
MTASASPSKLVRICAQCDASDEEHLLPIGFLRLEDSFKQHIGKLMSWLLPLCTLVEGPHLSVPYDPYSWIPPGIKDNVLKRHAREPQFLERRAVYMSPPFKCFHCDVTGSADMLRHHSAVEHAQILLPIAEEVPLSVAIRWVDRELMDPALITEEEEELGFDSKTGVRVLVLRVHVGATTIHSDSCL